MEIPQVGLGTYLAEDKEKFKAAIHYAVEECGYRHIDCAAFYKNQDIVGEALQEIFEKGAIKRSDLWITSKFWNTKHRPDLVVSDLKKTLSQLKLDYLDLYLVHWPVAFQSREDDEYMPRDSNGRMILENIDILDTWKGVEECYKLGLTKHIGVSNYSIEMLERMRYSKEVTIQPYCNQIEGHLYLQQKAMLAYLASRGMYLTCYTCVGRASLPGPSGYPLIKDPVVLEIAKETGRTPVQVCLRYLTQASKYYVVIPMSLNPVNIKGNFDLAFDLSAEQMERLSALDQNFRFVDPYKGWGSIDALCLGHN